MIRNWFGISISHWSRWRLIVILLVAVVAVGLLIWWGLIKYQETPVAAELERAQQLYTENNLIDSERRYQAIIDRWPDNYLALNGLGNVLRDRGNYAEAENMYRRVIELNPRYEFVYRNLLTLYQSWPIASERAIKLQAFAAIMERGLSLNNRSVQVVATALDYYRAQGNLTKATELETKLDNIS